MPFFRTIDLKLTVESNIIITVMNADKKISYLFKIYKKLEKLMHFRPALQTETYPFEYIAHRNKIKTSYYVQRMAEYN